MAYEIIFKGKALKDLKKMDHSIAVKIVNRIEINLSKEPPAGKMLTGDLRGMFSYRVGDYRVIYSKFELTITILSVGHRKEIYKQQEGL